MRADALAALDQLPGGTRASVVRRVCVLGAESTGKTTLARDLADALATVWVPEYGRDYTETLPDRLRYVWTTPDFEIISKRQNWNEDRAARYANRIVIVDTDAFATSLFHELYVGYRAPELDAYLRNYDLYLLTSIDTPFQMDNTGLRYDGDTRAFMDATYRRHAEESGRPWVTLQGPPAGAPADGRRRGLDDARALRRSGGAHGPARAGAGARRRTLILAVGLLGAHRHLAHRRRGLGLLLQLGALAEERHERDASWRASPTQGIATGRAHRLEDASQERLLRRMFRRSVSNTLPTAFSCAVVGATPRSRSGSTDPTRFAQARSVAVISISEALPSAAYSAPVTPHAR